MTDPRAISMMAAQDKARVEKIMELQQEIARLREEREQFNTLFAKAMEHNARLQQENADLIYTNREQAGMIEGAGVTIVKLREAIKRAANRHQDIDAGVVCCCELCEIAREKR